MHVGVNTAWEVCNVERPSMICVLINAMSLTTIVQHLEKLLDPSTTQLYDKNQGCAARMRPGLSTDP